MQLIWFCFEHVNFHLQNWQTHRCMTKKHPTQQPRSARTQRNKHTPIHLTEIWQHRNPPDTSANFTPLHRSNTGSPSRGAFAFGWPPPALWEPSSRGTERRGKTHKQNDKFMTSQDSYLQAARGQRRERRMQREVVSAAQGSALAPSCGCQLANIYMIQAGCEIIQIYNYKIVALTKQQYSPHWEWEQHDTFRKYICIDKEKDSMLTVWPSSAPEVCCTSQELEGKKKKEFN